MSEFVLKMGNALSMLANGAGSASASSSHNLTFFEKIAAFFVKAFKTIGAWFVEIFFNLFFLIGRFILNIIDFLCISVRALAGQNQISDLTSVSKLKESDMVFRFLTNSSVIRIFRAIIGIAIILLIVFTIIAIIKREFDSFLGGNEDNSKRQVIVRALTSIFLVIIVPFIAFGGIILSNALLASVDRALRPHAENNTIANQIFVASTYESNKYRLYAENGEKIPITFDFNRTSFDDLDLPESGQTEEQMETQMQSYLGKSVWNKGFLTWWQFEKEEFYTFEEVAKGRTVWNALYDGKIQASRSDYFVMADLVDYMLRTGNTLYVVNVYKLYEMYRNTTNADLLAILNRITNVAVPSEENNYTGSFSVKINSNYASLDPDVSTENDTKTYTYNNSHDEASGAVYVICTGEWIGDEENKQFVYKPLLNYTKAVSNYSDEFYTNYLIPNQMIVARGIFTKEGYPTAIRENGGSIEFYRESVISPSLVDILPQITYETQDGKFNLASGINFVFETITGLDLNDLIPKVYFRDDLFHLFTKEDVVVASLEGTEMYLDYNFAAGIPLYGVESIMDMNIIVLLFASILLISILAKAIFGLISRIFDLVLLFITYPVFAATMPLDNNRFKTWSNKFVGKLFGAYGIVIGLNLIFILLPVISDFAPLFTVEFVSQNIHGWGLSAASIATLLNYIVWLMFYLVAFTLFKSASKFVNGILFKDTEDIIDTGDAVMKDIKTIVQKTSSVVSGKIVVDNARKLAGDVKGFVPGSGLLTDRMDKDVRQNKRAQKMNDSRINALKGSMKAGDAPTMQRLSGNRR